MSWGGNGCAPRVVGHDDQLAELLAAVAEERSHHALLCTGPAGIGKRLAAELLGMAYLCEERTVKGPCGECRACLRFAAGSHPDRHLLTPAGKSAQGAIHLDKVRALAGALQLAPGEGVGRVAIVDQAQTLGGLGQNALLKTLEEPPPRTLFMLVAPRASDLLPTVRSRCQIIRFQPLAPALLRDLLAARESWPEEQIAQAAALGGGSVGACLAFLRGAGPELLQLTEEVFEMRLQDPVGLTERVLAVAAAEEEEETSQTGRRRRRALDFVRILQQVGGRRLRSSLEAGPDNPYDLAFADLLEKLLHACLKAENEILSNLDPTLVLEVLLVRLNRLAPPPR